MKIWENNVTFFRQIHIFKHTYFVHSTHVDDKYLHSGSIEIDEFYGILQNPTQNPPPEYLMT